MKKAILKKKPKGNDDKRFLLRMTAEEEAKVKRMAEKEGYSVNAFLRKVIIELKEK